MLLSELYQEETGGFFTHDGKDYDLNKLLKITDGHEIHAIPLDQLDWVLDYDDPDFKRMLKAKLSKPILVIWWIDPDTHHSRLVVLDGLHRVAKARIMKKRFVIGRYVDSDMLVQCLLDIA